MDGLLVVDQLESTEFVKSDLVNGADHSFFVKASYDLVEVNRSFTALTEPVTLSAFKAPDSVNSIMISDLASSSLTLSWSAGSLNGTKHSKYKVFDNDELLKEVVSNTVWFGFGLG